MSTPIRSVGGPGQQGGNGTTDGVKSMIFGIRPRSLQHKIIAAIVLVGLLPLTLSLVLTYVEQERAIRETLGANFKEVAVEAARRIEMHVQRGINEAEQLAATPFLSRSNLCGSGGRT